MSDGLRLNGTTGAAKADRSVVASVLRLTSKGCRTLASAEIIKGSWLSRPRALTRQRVQKPTVIQQSDISWFMFVATAWLISAIAMQQRRPDCL